MKNRITTPDGIRIIVDQIVEYWASDQESQWTGSGYRIKFANLLFIKSTAVHGSGWEEDFSISSTRRCEFDTTAERDAFLARLDNYFQEIA
jgi:hypothetical protein